jgi:acyl-CoA thioester hydrolase
MPLSDFHVTCEIRPRFRDTDAMGHINNAVYVTYLEVARQEYWTRVCDNPDYKRVPFILAHVSIDFRSEALVSDVIVVGIRCDHVGTKSFRFRYEIWEKATERLVAEGESVQVCYDYASKSTVPMPDDLRRAVEVLEGQKFSQGAAI